MLRHDHAVASLEPRISSIFHCGPSRTKSKRTIASADLARGGLWPTIVTAMVARSLLKLSVVIAKDLTSGSCELVTGSKSIGPTSPFGVWASAFAHSSISDFDKYFAFAALFSITNAPPQSPLPLAARV